MCNGPMAIDEKLFENYSFMYGKLSAVLRAALSRHLELCILILTFYLYTSYSWNETFTNSAKLFVVLVAALSSLGNIK